MKITSNKSARDKIEKVLLEELDSIDDALLELIDEIRTGKLSNSEIEDRLTEIRRDLY